jgi:hypothetical protein
MVIMSLEFKAPTTNIVSDVMSVIRSVKIMVPFFIVFLLG